MFAPSVRCAVNVTDAEPLVTFTLDGLYPTDTTCGGAVASARADGARTEKTDSATSATTMPATHPRAAVAAATAVVGFLATVFQNSIALGLLVYRSSC
jgi:hypothetical protein